MARPLAFFVFVFALAGCTTGPYAVTIRSARAPACDASIAALATSLPWDDYPVRVVRNTPLDGTSVDADGHFRVPVETMGRYRYLGEIESARATSYPTQVFASLLWMPEMHETTSPVLRALCWAQAPLRAMTLGAWAAIAPTSWPCFALFRNDPSMHLVELKRAAFAMGANTILIKDEESELVMTRKTHRIWNSGVRSMTAFAFIDTWAPSAVVELADEDATRLSAMAARCWTLPPSVRVVTRNRGGGR